MPDVDVDPDSIVSLHAIAEQYGFTYQWAKELGWRSVRAHREGRATTAHLPTPDRYIGGSPVWHQSDLDAWFAARPGKGAPWSGRPRGSRDKVKRKTRSDKGIPRPPAGWGSERRIA